MTNPARFALMANVRTRTLSLLQSKGWKGWTVSFDRSMERAGQCRYTKKEICFNILFLEAADAATVENTILHEVAHALAGPAASHGPHWAAICRSIGGTPNIQTTIPASFATHENFPWLGTCPSCEYTHGSAEAPEDIWVCSACANEHDKLERIFIWAKNGVVVEPLAIGGNFSAEYAKVFNLVAA